MGMYYRCDACNKELSAKDGIHEVCYNYKSQVNSGVIVREVCNEECAAVVLEKFAKDLKDKYAYMKENGHGR